MCNCGSLLGEKDEDFFSTNFHDILRNKPRTDLTPYRADQLVVPGEGGPFSIYGQPSEPYEFSIENLPPKLRCIYLRSILSEAFVGESEKNSKGVVIVSHVAGSGHLIGPKDQ